MRTLIYSLTFIIGSIFNSIVAQNFRTLPLQVKEHYYKDSVGYVFPIEPDSIKISNGDTTYFHFKSIRVANTTITIDYYYPPYFNLKGDSWAGKKTIIKANGDNIWFASKGDSILIKPLITLNGTWLVSGKYNLYGTVSGIALKTFCGIIDSVKTLKIGNYSFELSKNYGFIKMPDIYNFYTTSIGVNYPFSGPKSDVELYGSNLIKGTKTKLTDSLAYNFEVGDEFHYHTLYDSGYGSYSEAYSIEKILSKTILGTNTTVTYHADVCESVNLKSYRKVTTFSGEKLITKPYSNTGKVPNASDINIMDGTIQNSTLHFNELGLLQQTLNLIAYVTVNDTIYSELIITGRQSSDILQDYGFYKVEGLGSYSYYFSNSYWDRSTNLNNLHYYKGHLGTFGTNPYSCDSLIAQYTLATADEIKTQITPISPFDTYLKINTTQKLKQIRITDMLGVVKIEQVNPNVDSEQFSIDTQSLNAGMYLLQVTDVLGNLFSFKVLKE